MTSPALALRSFEYWLFQYKRTWRGSAVSTVLFPVLFGGGEAKAEEASGVAFKVARSTSIRTGLAPR